jgi:hypothetical protein
MLLILSRHSVPDNGSTPTSDLGGPLPWAPGSPGPGYARLPLARGVVCPDNLPLHRTDGGAWDRRRKTCRLSQALSPDRLSVPCPLIYPCHHHDIYCPTYAPIPYYYYTRGGVAWVVGVGPAKDLDGSRCSASEDTRLVEGHWTRQRHPIPRGFSNSAVLYRKWATGDNGRDRPPSAHVCVWESLTVPGRSRLSPHCGGHGRNDVAMYGSRSTAASGGNSKS